MSPLLWVGVAVVAVIFLLVAVLWLLQRLMRMMMMRWKVAVLSLGRSAVVRWRRPRGTVFFVVAAVDALTFCLRRGGQRETGMPGRAEQR